ncbi:hypothetical protein ACFLT8_07555 [Chloroflexota bacterium]
MTITTNQLGEYDLKVLIKTMVITHKHFIASLIDRNLYCTYVTEIASRLKEPVDKVKGALERLERDGWLVCEDGPGDEEKVQPTLKGWEVYRSFEIVYPEWDSPESLQVKYGSALGKIVFCKQVVDCFYHVLRERYGEKYREIIADS